MIQKINNKLNFSNNLIYLSHAELRMSQRNLKTKEIEDVIRFGHHFHRAGKDI